MLKQKREMTNLWPNQNLPDEKWQHSILEQAKAPFEEEVLFAEVELAALKQDKDFRRWRFFECQQNEGSFLYV